MITNSSLYSVTSHESSAASQFLSRVSTATLTRDQFCLSAKNRESAPWATALVSAVSSC